MKAYFHKVPIPIQHSFSIRRDVEPNFPIIWHYHPELEIHLTIRGEGVRFIGDNISNFAEGEIILLGENLPHTWRNSDEYYVDNADLSVEAIIIQFHPSCLGKDFFQLPEAYLIPKLFEKAKKGMLFKGKAKEMLSALLLQAPESNGMDRFIVLLQILRLMAETEEYEAIANTHAFYKSNESESESLRLSKIYNYALSNYAKDISIEEIASIAHLSATSFCRYFKTMTNKTFYNFLIEIRVSHACRYLIEDKEPAYTICFKCGFNNVSNFYRHFKKVMGVTPFEYKRRYIAETHGSAVAELMED